MLQGPPGPGNYYDNPVRNGDPVYIQPTSDDDQVEVTPIAGMDFEVMSPQIAEDYGAPRFFIDVNMSAMIGRRDDLGKVGIIGDMIVPQPEFNPTLIPETVIEGQGSKVDVTMEPFAVRAGIGMAFTHDFGEARIRFKPSVVYNRFEIKVVGQTHRAVQLTDRPTDLSEFRLIALRDARKDVFHGIGPAMEIEMDSGRVGDFVTSIFLKGHVSFVIGDTETELQANNGDPAGAGEYSRYKTEVSRWSSRVSTGFRIRWNPE
jgi:hypothetical protein